MAFRPLDHVLEHIRRIRPSPSSAVLGDGPLLERFLNLRDEGAFETIVSRHGPMVLSVCRRVLEDAHASEDAFQATFLVLLKKARFLKRRDLLANWLYGVAYRTALKAKGMRAQQQAREKSMADIPVADNQAEVVWRDLKPVLDAELNRLSARHRLPIVLCCLEGKTVAEAAAQLGWPVGSVAGRLARAKERLRRRLLQRGITLSTGMLGAVLSRDALAALPGPLLAATLRGVMIVAAGSIKNREQLSPFVVALTEGVLKAMFVTKLKIAAVSLLAAGMLGAGVLSYAQVAGKQTGPERGGKTEPFAQKPAGERAIDPNADSGIPKFPAFGKERAKAILDQSGFGDRMRTLLMARLDAAFEEAETRRRRYYEGKETLDIAIHSSLRLLEAERELSSKKADQRVALENHLQRMQELEKINRLKIDAGSLAAQDLAEVKFHRLQAEIWLERMKSP
jgi:RNA polymerase sigma factor (sigma-70 family)